MIELNKVYTDGDVFRTPIAVINNTVAYWFTSNQKELGKEVIAGYMPLDVFEKTYTQYSKPMTFQRIKEEGIKKLSNNGVTLSVIGFTPSGRKIVLCYESESEIAGAYSESKIQDWETVE